MIPFVKAHACGNDFLVVDETHASGKHAELALKLCARHTGLGADGVEFLDRREGFRLRLFNSDGSEAELSGNGTRCVAAVLAQGEALEQVVFKTHGGERRCKVVEAMGRRFLIESGMGIPRVMPRTLAVAGIGDVSGAMVNVGNPHFVIFPHEEDFSVQGMSWQNLGAHISVDERFPHGTNVEFVRLRSLAEIDIRIYERGCGPTLSSGTGTCASAAAAIRLQNAGRELTAIAEGGAQNVIWNADDSEMLLTGPAEILCRGEAYVD